MTKTVNTVTGSISIDKLGKTFTHEHFAFGYPGYEGDTLYSDQYDEALNLGINIAGQVLAQGISTVIDATPSDCGRKPLLLKEIAERTGLNIICATGYYYQDGGAPSYFSRRNLFGGNRDEEVYEVFKTELTKGIGNTGIKPGVIKLATSKDMMTEYEEIFFNAAARIAVEEKISIITHTQEGTYGLEQAEFLISRGIEPSRIVIGHLCCNTNMDSLLSIAETGVFLGFDRWGLQEGAGCPLDSRRIGSVLGLIGSGYAKQIVFSQDSINFWWGRPVSLSRLNKTWNINHLANTIIPDLKKAGVTDDILNTILADNPKRLFSASQ